MEVKEEIIEESVEEEMYWCRRCFWKGNFGETILREDRTLGCPKCKNIVSEV